MAHDPTEPPERTEPKEERGRTHVQAMLSKAHSARAQVVEARRDAEGPAALALASAESSIAQVEAELEGAAATGNVSEATLSSLKAVLASAERAADSAIQGAASASGGKAGGGDDLTTATANARQAVQEVGNDLFEKKKYDSYLKFNSEEEERAYRAREAKRKAEIDKAMAEGTPEGARRAAQLTGDQLDDAGNHGAAAHPDFKRDRTRIRNSFDEMDRAIRREGANHHAPQQLEGTDYRPHQRQNGAQEDMRTQLEKKGLPPEAIARVLATADPIRAARQLAAAGEKSAQPTHEAAKPAKGNALANVYLGDLGLDDAPAKQAAEAPKAKPDQPTKIAGVDLKGLGLEMGDSLAAERGHGLPDLPKPGPAKGQVQIG